MSICKNCFHSYVCEQFNENRECDNKKCHFANDHFVPTDLINRLQAQNDELFETVDYRLERILKLEDNLKTAKAENEILQAKIDGVQEANAILRNNNEVAINNAIKEFAERLKARAYLDSGITGFQDLVIDVIEVDDLLNELVGEE